MTASGVENGVFDDGPCGLLCAAHDRRITALNRTLACWLGHRADELIGRRFTEFFSGGGRIHYETHVALLEVNGEVAEWAADDVTGDFYDLFPCRPTRGASSSATSRARAPRPRR